MATSIQSKIYVIPKFTKKELDVANLCATALWYGVAYDTGKDQVSDASSLNSFAKQFYAFHNTGAQLPPPLMTAEVHELIRVCRVNILYRGMKGVNIIKGLNAIQSSIHPIYNYFISRKYKGIPQSDASICVKTLSDGFVVNPKHHRIVLSTRVLFFLVPNLMVFNLSTKVAKSMGLKPPTQNYLDTFYDIFANGLHTNQTQLSSYSLPTDTLNELETSTWNEVNKTDWWQRRVLDLAVLIHTGNTKHISANLSNLIKSKLAEKRITRSKTYNYVVQY